MAVATILLVSEFLGADFDGLLPGAVLALVLALLTSLMPLPTLIHGLLFALLAVVGVLALRRWSSGRRGQRPGSTAASANRARVRQPFNAEGQGRVQWRRRLWQAQCLDAGAPPEVGALVRVLGREGQRLLVAADSEPASSEPASEADQVAAPLNQKTSD